MHIEIQRLSLDTLVAGNTIPDAAHSALIDVIIPVTLRHRGVEAKLIIHAARGNAAAPEKNLIALVALYRPGPLSSGMVDTFIPLAQESKSIEGYGPGGHPKPEQRDYSLAWEI